MATVFASMKSHGAEKSYIRHMILNSLRMHNLKWRKDYGQMVLALDHHSWRKDANKYYKASRATGREESDIDWDQIYSDLNEITDEITENFPYPVVKTYGAEADDIIAYLVEQTQTFGNYEKVMIISGDKDFMQLQKYGNVEQYSPIQRRMLTLKCSPHEYIFEHIVRGDTADGIPNVLSEDDVFVREDLKQKRLMKKRIKQWFEAWEAGGEKALETEMGEETFDKYLRNKTLIDLTQIPEEVKQRIDTAYTEALEKAKTQNVLNYLIKNQMGELIGCANDFFPADK